MDQMIDRQLQRGDLAMSRHASIPSVERGRWTNAVLFAAALAVAAVVTMAVAVVVHPDPLPGEVASVRRWQMLAEPVPTLAEWIRLTTSTQATLLVAAVPAVWVIRRYRRAGVVAVVIVVVTMVIAQPVLKQIIDRPRPTAAQVDVRAPYTSKSFPSGHSMSTTAAWGTAAIVAARRHRPFVAVALCLPIASTGVASQVQGVHWPSDAVAGTLIGALAAGAAASVLVRADQRAPQQLASCP
jgi:membrane-associated phospholipid phosphatase